MGNNNIKGISETRVKRNNSSALRRRRKSGGFDPLPIDEARHPAVVRHSRKTRIFIATSSDVQNRRFTAFQGMIARGLCLPMGNKGFKGIIKEIKDNDESR